jgi:hypothetical protein
MTGVIPAPTGGEFDYLLRESHQARRRRRIIWITACIVAFVTLAPLVWAISPPAPHQLEPGFLKACH